MSEELNLPNLDGELDAPTGNTENTEKKEVKTEESPISADLAKDALMIKVLEFLEKQNSKSSIEVYGADGEQYVDERHIDEDDMLDREIVFYAHKAGYVIVDDTRNGVRVNNPYNKKALIFKYVHTKRHFHGREEQIEHLCQYVCKSKKEAEWLRKHTQFNITFFDKVDAEISVNRELAVLTYKYMKSIENMDSKQIRDISRQENLPHSSDIDQQRTLLAIYYAEKEKAANDEVYAQRVGNAITEQELLR